MTGTVEGMAGGPPPLGAVGRMRVMAAGVRGARVVEGVLPAAFDDVWLVMGDLDGGFGEFQPDMRKVRVESVDGDRVTALAHSRYGRGRACTASCGPAGAGCRAVSWWWAWPPSRSGTAAGPERETVTGTASGRASP